MESPDLVQRYLLVMRQDHEIPLVNHFQYAQTTSRQRCNLIFFLQPYPGLFIKLSLSLLLAGPYPSSPRHWQPIVADTATGPTRICFLFAELLENSRNNFASESRAGSLVIRPVGKAFVLQLHARFHLFQNAKGCFQGRNPTFPPLAFKPVNSAL